MKKAITPFFKEGIVEFIILLIYYQNVSLRNNLTLEITFKSIRYVVALYEPFV